VLVGVDDLSDERDPVSEAELGDGQYYRQPSREIHADPVWQL